MEQNQKIKSVLELATYKIGQVLYWVTLRPVAIDKFDIPDGDEWMMHCHPKVLYDRKIASKAWRYRNQLPRLCADDFSYVVDLLTSEPVVEPFEITNISRSSDTGEFYYANSYDDWMPESCLFTTAAAAKREKVRIKQMFKKWSERMSADEV